MDIEKIFSYVDAHKDEFIEDLRTLTTYKSISALPSCRKHCFEIADFIANQLKELGCTVTVAKNPLEKQTFPDGQTVELPPIVLASYGADPNKKTVCVYGHLDVQPADISDGWSSDPFVLKMEGDLMYGRGVTDNKGNVLCWISVLKTLKALSMPCDVNIKMVFEGMEESGSIGLDELINAEKDGFLKDVDSVCISDNWWLGVDKPCVSYGLRGLSYYFVEVSGPGRDLHSGVYGGTIREPLADLMYIMSKLIDTSGKILIPGIYDQVAPLTPEEESIYTNIDFDLKKYTEDINCTTANLLHSTKVDSLKHMWRYPSLSLHGIEGAFSGNGSKTVIPAKVTGKFSIRSVPNMVVEDSYKAVESYVKKLFEELKSPHKLKVIQFHGAPAHVSDVNHPNYKAAINATKAVYGVEPDLTRLGLSIPITLTFAHATGKNVILIPIGKSDGGAHSQCEKLNVSNYINGIKLFAAYFKELALSWST